MDDADRNESGLTPTEPAGDSLQGETEADPDGTLSEGRNRRYGFLLHYATAFAALSITYFVIAATAPPVRVLAHAIRLSDAGFQPLLFVLRVAGVIAAYGGPTGDTLETPQSDRLAITRTADGNRTSAVLTGTNTGWLRRLRGETKLAVQWDHGQAAASITWLRRVSNPPSGRERHPVGIELGKKIARRPRPVSRDGRTTRVEELDARVESLTTRRFPRADAFTHDPKLVSVRFPLHGAGARLTELIHQCTS